MKIIKSISNIKQKKKDFMFATFFPVTFFPTQICDFFTVTFFLCLFFLHSVSRSAFNVELSSDWCVVVINDFPIYEPHREKTGFLPRRK